MSLSFDYPYTQSIALAFRDLDALGHVNNAVYLSYFEDVRIRYLLLLLGDDSLANLPVIVAENTVQYLKPVVWNDRIEAGTRVASIGTKSFVMEYALRRQDGELVATGRTVLVWYDYSSRCSLPVPQDFRSAVERVQRTSEQ